MSRLLRFVLVFSLCSAALLGCERVKTDYAGTAEPETKPTYSATMNPR